MHKYQLFNAIRHRYFDIIFANYSTTLTGSTWQVSTLFHENGHLRPGFNMNAVTTPELQNAYKVSELMVFKLLASTSCVYLQKQQVFEATQQVEKICKDIILGDKANAVSEVLDSQATAPFLTIRSILREELHLKGRGTLDGTLKGKTPRRQPQIPANASDKLLGTRHLQNPRNESALQQKELLLTKRSKRRHNQNNIQTPTPQHPRAPREISQSQKGQKTPPKSLQIHTETMTMLLQEMPWFNHQGSCADWTTMVQKGEVNVTK